MSPKQVKRSEFGFTCPQCHFVPDIDDVDDYIRTHRMSSKTGERSTKNLKWPVRCSLCERNKKRYQRMRRRLEKIWDLGFAQSSPLYKRPKLITFALPSIWTFEEDPNAEVKKLEKLLPHARAILQDNNVRGGAYVLECTTRSFNEYGTPVFKHHAHVHMVAIAPYVHRTKLKEFCEQLIPLGLGRINYEAPSGKYGEAVKKVAAYISKYLVKDKRQARTFGILRNNQQEHSQCQKSEGQV